MALRILDGEWRISCSFMGSTITDTCDGQMTARVQNTDGGVAIDLAASESAMSCAGASLGIGSIGGQVRIASAEAGTPLRVDGARASP